MRISVRPLNRPVGNTVFIRRPDGRKSTVSGRLRELVFLSDFPFIFENNDDPVIAVVVEPAFYGGGGAIQIPPQLGKT